MSYSKTEKYAFETAKDIAAQKGYEIYDVEYVKEGPHWFLRIFIDSERGVNIDDCEAISSLISVRLDKDDAIPQEYFLEVSSPGIERSLRLDRHFQKAIGEKISVIKKSGERVQGVLTGYADEIITIDNDIAIQKKDVKKANILFDGIF